VSLNRHAVPIAQGMRDLLGLIAAPIVPHLLQHEDIRTGRREAAAQRFEPTGPIRPTTPDVQRADGELDESVVRRFTHVRDDTGAVIALSVGERGHDGPELSDLVIAVGG
jgi:hypothetical protein